MTNRSGQGVLKAYTVFLLPYVFLLKGCSCFAEPHPLSVTRNTQSRVQRQCVLYKVNGPLCFCMCVWSRCRQSASSRDSNAGGRRAESTSSEVSDSVYKNIYLIYKASSLKRACLENYSMKNNKLLT